MHLKGKMLLRCILYFLSENQKNIFTNSEKNGKIMAYDIYKENIL